MFFPTLECACLPGTLELEADPLFQIEAIAILESPGLIVDGGRDAVGRAFGHIGKLHGIGRHGVKQSLGGMGADDLALEAILDQLGQAPEVVDVGMGEKQVDDPVWLHPQRVDRRVRVPGLGQAASRP